MEPVVFTVTIGDGYATGTAGYAWSLVRNGTLVASGWEKSMDAAAIAAAKHLVNSVGVRYGQ